MIRRFRSAISAPRPRGGEFGTRHASQIRNTLAIYGEMFDRLSGGKFDMRPAGRAALDATRQFSPALADEMIGLAEGSGVDPVLIGALNARTEILALLKAGLRGECSAVIHVAGDDKPPVAVQTWDWYLALRDSWLVWDIPHADGSCTSTMTEYGIVGKAGLNTRGLGLLFTILHHAEDGRRVGVPVHVVARHLLDSATNIAYAAQRAASADVSASSSLNLLSREDGVSAAITVELNPGGPGFVLPGADGFLIHTNHFLAAGFSAFDIEPQTFPDTLLRHNLLTRRMATLRQVSPAGVLNAMASHSGGAGAVCCHHDSESQYETLSTIMLDVARGELTAHAGGPCTHPGVKAAPSA
jgi:isopenicillin-N N-acyltransferase like protein